MNLISLPGEEWKPVRGFPSYLISNLGRVYSQERRGRILKPDKTGVSTLGRVTIKNSYGRKCIGISTLMSENWKWEWIKELEEGEEVKPVGTLKGKSFPLYFITNRGRVFSLNTYSWCEGGNNQEYYTLVTIRDSEGNRYTTTIHSLVGKHFLDNWEEGVCILHKDETLPYPEINYVENLWIGTKGDNNRDRCLKGRSGGFMKGRTYKGVLQIK